MVVIVVPVVSCWTPRLWNNDLPRFDEFDWHLFWGSTGLILIALATVAATWALTGLPFPRTRRSHGALLQTSAS